MIIMARAIIFNMLTLRVRNHCDAKRGAVDSSRFSMTCFFLEKIRLCLNKKNLKNKEKMEVNIELFYQVLLAMLSRYNPNNLPDQILHIFIEFELSDPDQPDYVHLAGLQRIVETLNIPYFLIQEDMFPDIQDPRIRFYLRNLSRRKILGYIVQ